jgi:O-antigen/teichoic acid export membrane protein
VTYALALGAVLAPVSDLGLQLTATREIAASPSRASTLAAEAWRIKWQLSLVAAVLTLLAIRWREPALRSATAGIALSVIASSIVEFFGYLLRGVGRVTDDAVLVLSARGIVVASGLAALAMGAGIDGLAVAYAPTPLRPRARPW